MVVIALAAGSARWAQVTIVLLAHHAVPPATGPTESDWIRWTGVLITAVGTLVAAPSGVARLFRAVTGTLALIWWILKLVFSKKTRSEVGQGVRALFKFLGLAMLKVLVLAGKEPEPEPPTPAKTQIQWEPGESVDAKLDRLRSWVEQAFEQISDVCRDAQSADAELNKALDQVKEDLQKANEELRSRMDAAEKQAAAIDSRGILLLGAGVILTGIPDELAHFAWVGWAAIGVSVFVIFSVLLGLVREWLGRRLPATATAA